MKICKICPRDQPATPELSENNWRYPPMKRLKTLSDCRRFMQRIINEAYDGQLDSIQLGRLSHAVNVLAGVIKDGDLEERLQRLEEQMGEQNAKKN